jgi:hypothetical protein
MISPDEAAAHVVKELSSFAPGSEVSTKDYMPEMFSLGYFSLPKRREQAFMQPVYVALLRAQGNTTLNRMIVVPGAITGYKSICRIATTPPKDAIKPQPKARLRN